MLNFRMWGISVALLAPVSAGADVVSLFDEVAANTITLPPGVVYPAVTPEEQRPLSNQDAASVHIAIYDAVVAISGGYHPFANSPATPAAGASVDAAAASAACTVLRGLFPNRAPQYEPACATYIGALPDGDARTRGLAIGGEIGAATLEMRADDGRMASASYLAGSDPGDFRGVNPVNVFLPSVRPFALMTAAQFRADGPPDLTSYTYAQDLNEVKAFGGAVSTLRTAEQLDLARFNTEPPPRFWARNLRRFVSDARPVVENARLMAMLYVISADAIEACFDSKYHFDFWRPQSAIPLADTDGNPATTADAAWTPVVPTPNHPEYPAAHGCNTGAVAGALERFFGTNKIDFIFDSAVAGLATPVREYHSTDQLMKDVINARIFGGMHYRNSGVDGTTLGLRVAKWIGKNYFRPKAPKK